MRIVISQSISLIKEQYKGLLYRNPVLLSGNKMIRKFGISKAFTRAEIVRGSVAAWRMRKTLQREVQDMTNSMPRFKPKIAIIHIGDQKDALMKMKEAKEIGIDFEVVRMKEPISQGEVMLHIQRLNEDPTVHGITVQNATVCTEVHDKAIQNMISPEKDIDGLSYVNQGKLHYGDLNGFIPPAALGILELIKMTSVELADSSVLVLGRNEVIGMPCANLLMSHDAIVTNCNETTRQLANEIYEADILIIALNYAKQIKPKWLKQGAVVIDCWMNEDRNPEDPVFKEMCKMTSFITPEYGGLAPATITMLMKNLLRAAQKEFTNLTNSKWRVKCLPLKLQDPLPSDLKISQLHPAKNITVLAEEIGLKSHEINCYGHKMAKINLSVMKRLKHRVEGNYVVMTGITPTPFGEGKTTAVLGLVQALTGKCHKNAVACIRQPSQGPTFGIKGGAAGGGYAQVIPMEEFNLHLTGDVHAVTAANNLLAAQIDARMFHEATQSDKVLFDRLVPTVNGNRIFTNDQLRRLTGLDILTTDPNSLTEDEINEFVRLNIDPNSISLLRVLDTNDRFLREIEIGLSPAERGLKRRSGFAITVSSEVMAILSLADDFQDLKERLGSILVAYDTNGTPITANDLGVTGAMAILLKDAVNPSLMQSIEGTPVLVHGAPFANIAHGCSSVIADKLALKLVGPKGYVVTEAGFGSDVGLEKFVNIKCRTSQLSPNLVILVTTVRALKLQGGGPNIVPGRSIDEVYLKKDCELLCNGLPHLERHIKNCTTYEVPVIVAVNVHKTDTEDELNLVLDASTEYGAKEAHKCRHWEKGGAGALDLARSVIRSCKFKSDLRFLYDLSLPIDSKVAIIAEKMYGTTSIEYSKRATKCLKMISELSIEAASMPICIAKTPLSLTGDPKIKGVPVQFRLVVNDVRVCAGAQMVVAHVGEITLIPGLPIRPNVMNMDIDTETGEITGLS